MIPIAALPNPSEPAFVAMGAVIGGFIGDSVARLRRYDADNSMQATITGSYYGTGLALAAYFVANLLEGGFQLSPDVRWTIPIGAELVLTAVLLSFADAHSWSSSTTAWAVVAVLGLGTFVNRKIWRREERTARRQGRPWR